MFQEFVNFYLDGLDACRRELSFEKLESILSVLLVAHREARKIFILGNGGSASAASHFACDLSKGTAVAGKQRFRVLSLTDNVALLTAWANDTSYEMVS
jgi:D-sedoheptulose 7-phosphate isomerase